MKKVLIISLMLTILLASCSNTDSKKESPFSQESGKTEHPGDIKSVDLPTFLNE